LESKFSLFSWVSLRRRTARITPGFYGTQIRYMSTYKLSTCKQNTNKLLKLFMSNRLLLLMLLIPPLQLPHYFYTQSNFSFYILASNYPWGEGGGGVPPNFVLPFTFSLKWIFSEGFYLGRWKFGRRN
jgi:hypothetical protein